MWYFVLLFLPHVSVSPMCLNILPQSQSADIKATSFIIIFSIINSLNIQCLSYAEFCFSLSTNIDSHALSQFRNKISAKDCYSSCMPVLPLLLEMVHFWALNHCVLVLFTANKYMRYKWKNYLKVQTKINYAIFASFSCSCIIVVSLCCWWWIRADIRATSPPL